MFGMIKSVWSYRSFVVSSVRNEFVTQFARSRFGAGWMLITPLAQVTIYALILSNVLSAKLPGIENKYAYALYLMAGILAWSLFSEIINKCLNLFISQGNLMKKVSFPKVTLPVIVVGSSLINNIFLFFAVIVVFIILGHTPEVNMVWIIPLTIVTMILALGLGLILGILNVFIRDIGQIVPIVLQTLFWFTPIVYPLHIIPQKLQSLVLVNPLLPIVTAYQDVLVYGKVPEIGAITTITIVAVVILIISLFMFRRATAEMVDAL